MPTEVADYIGELDQSKPQGSESVGESDDHHRLVKKTLTQSFLGDGASDLWDTACNVGPRYFNSLLTDFTPDNYVTLDGAQTITGQKTITAAIKGDIGLVNDVDLNLVSQAGPSVAVGNYGSPAIVLTDGADGITQAWDSGGTTATVLNDANWQAVVIDVIYPIGSVIYSASPTNPGTRFTGTTWVATATGRFVAGVGNHTDDNGDVFNIPAGDVIEGEYNHTLTEPEMPVHGHDVVVASSFGGGALNRVGATDLQASSPTTNTDDIKDAGSGGEHNNIPPGFGMYVWERTV